MKKSLGTVLVCIFVLAVVLMKILTRSWLGPVILLAMAALYFVLTVVSEAFKIYAEKTKGRDRNP